MSITLLTSISTPTHLAFPFFSNLINFLPMTFRSWGREKILKFGHGYIIGYENASGWIRYEWVNMVYSINPLLLLPISMHVLHMCKQARHRKLLVLTFAHNPYSVLFELKNHIIQLNPINHYVYYLYNKSWNILK